MPFGIKIAIYKKLGPFHIINLCRSWSPCSPGIGSHCSGCVVAETFAEGVTSGEDEQVEMMSESSQKQKKRSGWQR